MSNITDLRLKILIKRYSQIEYVNYITIDSFGKVRCFEYEPKQMFDLLYGGSYVVHMYGCSNIDDRAVMDGCPLVDDHNARILWRRNGQR